MPATKQEIAAILNSDQFDESDKFVVEWQFGILGDFQDALIKAIVRADEGNQAKLALGFPMQVEGYRRWAYGDLGGRLRKAGLNI